MSELKRAGVLKQYEVTDDTFTKKGMWENRYINELSGIALATAAGIRTPRVIESNFDETGGTIVYERHHGQRLDEVLWADKDEEVLTSTGSTLATIHDVTSSETPSLELPQRRFEDLQRDILSRSKIPNEIVTGLAGIFNSACQDAIQDKTSLVHGDYVLQNIFDGDPLIVFDWEHSCVGPAKYDLGVLLSYMLLPVLDGQWDMKDYFEGCDRVLEGYGSTRSLASDDPLTHTFRLIGHRQIPQYYFMTIEYLAELKNEEDMRCVLRGETTLDETRNLLAARDIVMDEGWLEKMVIALQSHAYQTSPSVWEYARGKSIA